jgi:hypothetical protein
MIPTGDSRPYNILFMSENDTFLNVYPKLNIRRQFAKKITQIPFKNPRIIATIRNLIPYKKALGLIPTITPDSTNTYIDINPFLDMVDSRYGKQSYRRPIVFQKIVSYLNEAKKYNSGYNILVYHVNLSKPINDQFFYRRSSILSMISQIGEGAMPFDNVVIATQKGGSISFSSIFNRDQKPLTPAKIMSVLKRLTSKEEVDVAMEMKLESIDIVHEDSEKDSILRFINKYQKKKVLTS